MISFPMNTVLIINLVVPILIVMALLLGYYNGFIKQVFDLVVLITSLLIAWPTSNLLSKSVPILSRNLSIFNDIIFGQYIYEISNIFIWFLILLILLATAFHQILKPFVKDIKQLKWMKQVDKLLGIVVAIIPQMIWILIFMIISLSPIFENGRSTLEASLLNPLVTVSQTLSDTFVGQVDPYGIVVKISQNQELSEKDISNIPVWLEEFGIPENSAIIVKKFINDEKFEESEIAQIQEYIDINQITETQARVFLEKFGYIQARIDNTISEFKFAH